LSYKITRRGNVTTFTGTGRDIGKSFATTKKGSAATARFRSILKAKGQKLDIIPTTEPLRTGEYFEQAEKAEARQVGISQSKPVLIPIKNVRGQIVGVRDTKSRQSISVTPGTITQRQLDISEGITDINKTIRQQQAKAVIKAIAKPGTIGDVALPKNIIQRKAFLAARKAERKIKEAKEMLAEDQKKLTLLKKLGVATPAERAALAFTGLGQATLDLIPSKQFIKDIGILANANPIYSQEKIAALQRVKNKGIESWEGIKGLPTFVKENPEVFVGQLILIALTIELLKGTGRRVAATKVTLAEESFIKSLPRNLRGVGRKLLKSPSVRKIINPSNLKKLNVNTIKLKALTKLEINALKKTLNKADSITLGAKTTRMTNFNMVTADISQFNRQFMKSLPTKLRRNYGIVGKNIVRKATNKPIFEIKPISQMKIASQFKLKPRATKRLKIATKPLKKALKPVKKVGKIVRIGGERLSKANVKAINTISNKLNSIGVDVRLVKSSIRNRIKTIKASQIKKINGIIKEAKYKLKAAKVNVTIRTQIFTSVFRKINRILRKANIELKGKIRKGIKETKERVGEVKAVKKTERFVIDVQNKLNVATFNTNQRIKFTKLSVKKAFKEISEGVKRDLTRELNNYRREFRILLRGTERTYDGFGKLILEKSKRLKLTRLTKRFVTRANKKLKKFNYKIEVKKTKIVSTTKRVVRIRIRGTERFFSGTGKKILEVERRTKLRQTLSKVKISRLTKKISSINKKFGLNIKISKFKLKQKVRIAKFPIDRAINRKLTQLNNYLTKSKGKITAPVKKIANEINKMIPFEIERPSVMIIKGFKVQRNIISTQAKAQSLFFKQQALERKIKAGKQFKATRDDFYVLDGKKKWLFFDEELKKGVQFSSRKLWLKAIKQQAKVKPKGLVKTLKPIMKAKLKEALRKQKRALEQVREGEPISMRVGKVEINGRIGFPLKGKSGKIMLIKSRRLWLKAIKRQAKLKSKKPITRVVKKVEALTLEKERRLLRRQQSIENKIKQGKQVKATRTEFRLTLEGKKIYPFINSRTGILRNFTSRKLWLKAVKQQAKVRPKGLVKTFGSTRAAKIREIAKQQRKAIKFAKQSEKARLRTVRKQVKKQRIIDDFFKNPRAMKGVTQNKLFNVKKIRGGIDIVDKEGKSIISVAKKFERFTGKRTKTTKFTPKTPKRTDLPSGRGRQISVLQLKKPITKIKLTSAQAIEAERLKKFFPGFKKDTKLLDLGKGNRFGGVGKGSLSRVKIDNSLSKGGLPSLDEIFGKKSVVLRNKLKGNLKNARGQKLKLEQRIKQAKRIKKISATKVLNKELVKLVVVVKVLEKQIGVMKAVQAIKTKQKIATKTLQKVAQAVKQAQKVATKTATAVKVAQAVAQKIIPKLLQETVKITTKKLPIPPLSFDIKKLKQLKKLTKKELKKDKFIYIPDLYSRIYGIYANPKEKRMLLRKGAVFSGIDIRKRI